MICLDRDDVLYLTGSFIIIKLNNFQIKHPQKEGKSLIFFSEQVTEMHRDILLIPVQLLHFTKFYCLSSSWFKNIVWKKYK